MAFYDKLLKDVNSRMGFDVKKNKREDFNDDLALSFSAKPKDTLSLEMSKTTETSWDNDKSETSDKTASKLEINHGDCTTTWGFENEKMSFSGKGKAYDADGWKVDISGGAETNQAAGTWKANGNADISGDLGSGAKAGVNVTVEYNEKKETTLKPRINIDATSEISVGASAVHNTADFKDIWTQAVYRPADCAKKSFYWLRADLKKNFLSAGCNHALNDNITHSFEAQYGWVKDFKGIKDHPVVLRGGVEYALSDQTSVSASAFVGQTYSISKQVEHKVDNHWTVSCTQFFDSANIGKAQSPYHIGFSAAYKL